MQDASLASTKTSTGNFWARSEAGLSRLPVTEEIAGSNPVGPASIDFGAKRAKQKTALLAEGPFFICANSNSVQLKAKAARHRQITTFVVMFI
jgi:hypothetical protein